MTSSEFDVVVVGAGIVGIACAEACAAAGLRVVVLDRAGLATGATGAAMGHIVVPGDGDDNFALARYSQRLWGERAPELPDEVGLRKRGTLWVAETDAHLGSLEALERAFRTHDIPAERLSPVALLEREPQLSDTLAGALLAPEDLVLDPSAATAHLWKRAEARGACLRVDRAVRGVGAGRARLEGGEELRGSWIVVAAGAGTPALIPGLPVRPRKGHLVSLESPAEFVRHQVVEVGYLASVASNSAESISFNVQPGFRGRIIVGASRQYGSDSTEVEPAIVQKMLRRAERFLPTLSHLRRVRTWAGLRPASADHLPFIGALPEDPRTIVAAGHEGLGITESLGTGRLVTDIVLGRPSEIPRAPYALEGRNLLGAGPAV